MLCSVCLFLLFVPANFVFAAEVPNALKPFQGEWELKTCTLGGRNHDDDFFDLTLTIQGNKYTVSAATNVDEGTIVIDDAVSPKQITLKSTKKEGPFKGRTMPGIYQWKDGELTVCLNSEKEERPEKFEAPAKTPLMLFVFRQTEK